MSSEVFFWKMDLSRSGDELSLTIEWLQYRVQEGTLVSFSSRFWYVLHLFAPGVPYVGRLGFVLYARIHIASDID